MGADLTEYLRDKPCQGFHAVPRYSRLGDTVTFFFAPDRCHAQRVDDLLTVYLSHATGQLVGCKIKGVQHILRTAGEFGVELEDGVIRLGLFFFVGALQAQAEPQRRRYRELGELAKNVTLDRSHLQAV